MCGTATGMLLKSLFLQSAYLLKKITVGNNIKKYSLTFNIY
jgi:hypothetical protein